MINVFVRRAGGATECVDEVDPAWLKPDSGVTFWVDIEHPGSEEGRLLREVFGIHELAVEDALSDIQYPKIEQYGGVLYLILHGINFEAAQHEFATHDIDFFVGRNYLITVHSGRTRTVAGMRDVCLRSDRVLAEGPVALLHRIVDSLVDNYRPEIDKFEQRLESLEGDVIEKPHQSFIRSILGLKRDIASLRRVALPQRDVIGRLARREFDQISPEIAYRFRDVHDHLVRITDEALIFQDRVTGILEAHLTTVSNRLNQVMKVLTVIATIFMPLTVLTGMWGMNIPLPQFPGGEGVQFWWIFGIMLAISGTMLLAFWRSYWL